MTTSRKTVAALSVAALLGISACGSGEAPSAGGENDTSSVSGSPTSSGGDGAASPSPSETSPASAPADELESLLAAIATAEKAQGGTAYEVDDQDEDGTWEIDVAVKDKSVEVTVSADGSEVVSTDDEDDLDDDEREGLDSAKKGIGEAITTAMQEVDGTFDDAELEDEDEGHVWEVAVDTADGDVEVRVDVVTGKVVDRVTD